jgi:hypothetical protein
MGIVARTFNITVVSSAAPAWFTALPYLQWTPIAGGPSMPQPYQRGARLDSTVAPGPYQGNQSMDDIVQAGNGAAIDQDNLEMWLVCNGGHSGRNENDSFRLVLNTEVPYYQRVTESTPFADLDWHFDSDPTPDPLAYEYYGRLQQISPGNGIPASGTRTWNMPDGTTVSILDYPACAGDGAISDPGSNFARQQWKPWTITVLNDIDDRPRTMHTCYTQWYANGKVWFPVQNSVDEGSGPTHNITMSFDATRVRNEMVNNQPRPFNPGRDVWDYYVPVTQLGTVGNLFGATCLDPTTNKVWYHPGNEAQFFAVHTNPGTPAPGTYTRYADPVASQSAFTNAPSAICPVAGRRLWVVLQVGPNHADGIRVYDLESIETNGTNATNCQRILNIPTIANKIWHVNHDTITAGDQKKGWGMVWFEPDKSFLLYNCDDMPNGAGGRSGNLRRLKMPLDGSGNYNPAGTWECDEVAVGGLPDQVTGPGTTAISGSSFTRFNIFNDMGNGESMLVSQGNFDTPCYVCRLPNTTLTGI